MGEARVGEGTSASASVQSDGREAASPGQRPGRELGLLLWPSTLLPPGLDKRSAEAE